MELLRRFVWAVVGLRARARAGRALEHALEELEIDWQVDLIWERRLPALGLVRGAERHEIRLREGQKPGEAVRTTLHEACHLAQFHKWRSLSPLRGANSPSDLARAEALAELYSRITAREIERSTPGGRLRLLPRLLRRPRRPAIEAEKGRRYQLPMSSPSSPRMVWSIPSRPRE